MCNGFGGIFCFTINVIGRISRLGEGRLKPHLQELNPPTRVSKPLVRVGGLCLYSRVGKACPKGLFYSPGCIPHLLDTPL